MLSKAAVAELKLVDHDWKSVGSSIADCEQVCNGMRSVDCAVVMWHLKDNHCHTQSGNVSQATFSAALSKDKDYTTCILVSTPHP